MSVLAAFKGQTAKLDFVHMAFVLRIAKQMICSCKIEILGHAATTIVNVGQEYALKIRCA